MRESPEMGDVDEVRFGEEKSGCDVTVLSVSAKSFRLHWVWLRWQQRQQVIGSLTTGLRHTPRWGTMPKAIGNKSYSSAFVVGCRALRWAYDARREGGQHTGNRDIGGIQSLKSLAKGTVPVQRTLASFIKRMP